MPLKVHLLQNYDRELCDHLTDLLDKNITLSWGEDLSRSSDYKILISGVPTKESIEFSSNLKTLIIPWAGLPSSTRKLMLNYPHISIHNIHYNAVTTAEAAFALMISLAKDIVNIDRSFRKNDWGLRYDSADMELLSGKKALILGYGAIGKEIALRCKAFGMNVTAVKKEVSGTSDEDIKVFPVSELDNLLPSAEILFLSIPLTPKTKEMIGKKRLSLLPQNAILVNISRGRIIQEQALFDELKTGRIKAGLDVWYNYPESEDQRTNTPPSKYPFHKLPNVIITPHLAGHANRIEKIRAQELANLLNLAARNKPLPNKISLERGY